MELQEEGPVLGPEDRQPQKSCRGGAPEPTTRGIGKGSSVGKGSKEVKGARDFYCECLVGSKKKKRSGGRQMGADSRGLSIKSSRRPSEPKAGGSHSNLRKREESLEAGWTPPITEGSV